VVDFQLQELQRDIKGYIVAKMKGVRMGWLEITDESLKKIVAGLGPIFNTKDVSEDPQMKRTYADLVRHSQYHAFVGRALSEYRTDLGIVDVPEMYSKERGTLWKKN